ncbi:MAG TPA: hypothetical protein VK838_04520 [Candidatus Limnocylindrales bacterium]|nr:hypothetical protein [Candidatus Limnocylindrales bacterium]
MLAVLLLVAVAVGVGSTIYNAGLTAGLDEAARTAIASGEAVPVAAYGYGPYWHGPWGFGFFGIIFWILGIFLIFGLLRAAFGWGRWGGRGHGNGGPGGWGSRGRGEMVEEWHRELHRRESGASGRAEGSSQAGGSGA